jgi:hypothetical protein
MKTRLFSLVLGGLFLTQSVLAQDGANQITYSTLAQQFVQNNQNGDAHSTILPSVAIANGFGSFIDNPASVALITDTYFSIGYLSNHAENTNTFKNVSSTIDGQLGRFSNIGLIYSAPTEQGSLVFGGGYTVNNSINRNNLLAAQNSTSTITDVFKESGSSYNDIAFETYAIDYADVQQTQLESIFRIGFEPGTFPGIYQDVEVIQTSSIGELSLFAATEFQQNLFLGASIAVVSGTHNYSRNFFELDSEDAYDGDFLFADENGQNGTDIHSVLLTDDIDSDVLGTSIRVGGLYKVLPNLNVGVSYAFANKYFITEDYYARIRTTFDDNSTSEDDFEGDFTYEVRRPAQLNLGIALDDIYGFTFSGSVELIDYSSTELTLTSDADLSFEEISALRDDETVINNQIANDYNNVTNLKGGIKYLTKNGYELRAGVAYLPGKSNIYDADRSIFSGGIGIPLSANIYLDVTSQYSRWNDRSIVYEYFDDVAGQVRSESISEDISQLNVLVGFKFRF